MFETGIVPVAAIAVFMHIEQFRGHWAWWAFSQIHYLLMLSLRTS